MGTHQGSLAHHRCLNHPALGLDWCRLDCRQVHRGPHPPTESDRKGIHRHCFQIGCLHSHRRQYLSLEWGRWGMHLQFDSLEVRMFGLQCKSNCLGIHRCRCLATA